MDQLYSDLQDTGLLDFAAEVGFLEDLSASHKNQAKAGSATQAAAQTAQAGDGKRKGSAGRSQPEAPAGPDATARSAATTIATSDAAVAKAEQALASSQQLLHQVTAASNHGRAGLASMGSTTQPAAAAGMPAQSSKPQQRNGGRAAAGNHADPYAKPTAKGLRHFSLKVCEVVEMKGRTTYNEVADDLVKDFQQSGGYGEQGQYDEKNIRRRVYDALNVLMAMDIIQKEKKEITWKGLPDTPAGPSTLTLQPKIDRMKVERLHHISEVDRKASHLQELLRQHATMKWLVGRNAANNNQQTGTAVHLPFLLIQASPSATVEVKISDDMKDVQFDIYNSVFQLHDDCYVLRNMASTGMCTAAPAAGGGNKPGTPKPTANNAEHVQGLPPSVKEGVPRSARSSTVANSPAAAQPAAIGAAGKDQPQQMEVHAPAYTPPVPYQPAARAMNMGAVGLSI